MFLLGVDEDVATALVHAALHAANPTATARLCLRVERLSSAQFQAFVSGVVFPIGSLVAAHRILGGDVV